MQRDYANYHVALKVLMRKGDEILFLLASGDRLDLPGGRIDNVEHDTPLPKILEREIREELGQDVKYKLGKPVVQFRRHVEHKGWHVFLTAYEADFLSGTIQISPEHSGLQWINIKSFPEKPDLFFNPEEYEILKQYFDSLS